MWGVPTGQIGRDITESKKQHFAIISGLEYDPELIIRVNNVSDITVLSHDIRRAVVHGVHLRYERQQNYLDIYFEKKQDYVLVKMFME